MSCRCCLHLRCAQISLGLVLPTLMLWRAQCQAAQQWVAEQQAREQPRARRRRLHPGRQPPTVAEMELAASQYATVAAPVLQAAQAFPGGWLVLPPVAAMLAWVAAVLTRTKWAVPCAL